MYPFEYLRPRSVAEAVACHRQRPDGRYLAGGMTLLPVMKQRLAAPSLLIDLRDVPGLAAISLEGDRLAIGAMATHAAIAASPAVAASIPALAWLAGEIGDPQVRNLGTLGGAVANSDPAADYPAALLALAATIVTDRREIAADAFIKGLFRTALADDELIVRIDLPVPLAAGYARFCQQASRYPLAAVMVARTTLGARVAVTGAAPAPFRWPEAERALDADFAPAALAALRLPADGLNADIHAGADYRAHLVAVLARRALAAAG